MKSVLFLALFFAAGFPSAANIHIAAATGSVPDIRKQLMNGVSVNLKDGNGYTPLHYAAAGGHWNAVTFLVVMCNARVSALSQANQTPIDLAVEYGRTNIEVFLCRRWNKPSSIEGHLRQHPPSWFYDYEKDYVEYRMRALDDYEWFGLGGRSSHN